MGQPKKRSTPKRTADRRSSFALDLAKQVNRYSPIKAFQTRNSSGAALTRKIRTKQGR